MEDHLHIFRDCPFACATWTRFLPLSTAHNYQMFFYLIRRNGYALTLVNPGHSSFQSLCGIFGVIGIIVCLIRHVSLLTKVWQHNVYDISIVSELYNHLLNT